MDGPVTISLPVLSVRRGESDPLLAPEGDVLSTMNRDGSRRWLRPKVSPGRFLAQRRAVGWLLIAFFAVLPWLRIGGEPPILLDVMTRRFVFFGAVYRPTDTLLLALLILAVFLLIFLLTALLGRVWCGWACPQTVYMEFVYRSLERLFLGRSSARAKHAVPAWRRVAMFAAFALISAHCANTFLAYFVGTDRLVEWTLAAPTLHPTAFIVFAVTAALMFFDFAYWREQMCTLVCPYGRLQAVLLDRDSIIVGYDAVRGEPRGKRGSEGAGDCIDCTLCVQTCPMGIDIRDGLQLECIHCAQCIDACDAVMAKIGRAPGLIRYSSQNRLERTARRGLRLRLIFYPVLLAAALTALVMFIALRRDALVVQLRSEGTPYAVTDDGVITSTVRLRIDNRTRAPRTYRVEPADSTVLREPVEVSVAPFEGEEIRAIVVSRSEDFTRGKRLVRLRVTDGKTYDEVHELSVIGPFGQLDAKEDQ